MPDEYKFVNNDLAELNKSIGNITTGQNVNAVTIDITGQTVIDMSGKEYAGVVNLTSGNPAETIRTLTNTLSNKNIIFRPSPGLSVDFKNKDVGHAGSNLRLYAADQIANGTKQGFISLQKRGADFFETNFMDEYL